MAKKPQPGRPSPNGPNDPKRRPNRPTYVCKECRTPWASNTKLCLNCGCTDAPSLSIADQIRQRITELNNFEKRTYPRYTVICAPNLMREISESGIDKDKNLDLSYRDDMPNGLVNIKGIGT